MVVNFVLKLLLKMDKKKRLKKCYLLNYIPKLPIVCQYLSHPSSCNQKNLTLYFPEVFPLPVEILLCFPRGSKHNLNLFGSRATGLSPVPCIPMLWQFLGNRYMASWVGGNVLQKRWSFPPCFHPQDACLYHCGFSKPFKSKRGKVPSPEKAV